MEQIIPADALPKCDHCKKEAQQHEKFCVACGYPMQGTDEEKKKFHTLNKVKHISLDEYEGKVKSARTTLYVVAGVMALSGLLMLAIDKEQGMLLLVINLILAAVYVGLGFWSKNKPFAAIISGLVIFITLHLLNAFADPKTLAQGIIMKVLVIGYLIKGLKGAREAESIKKELNIT